MTAAQAEQWWRELNAELGESQRYTVRRLDADRYPPVPHAYVIETFRSISTSAEEQCIELGLLLR